MAAQTEERIPNDKIRPTLKFSREVKTDIDAMRRVKLHEFFTHRFSSRRVLLLILTRHRAP